MIKLVQLSALSAINIGMTYVLQAYVLIQLGPGIETDALFAGMTVPQLALTIISGSLMHVLVPLLAGEDDEKLKHDAWGFFILIGFLFISISIIMSLTAGIWVPLTVPGFSDVSKLLTTELTRIQLIGIVFSAINGVQLATYHARQRFIWADLSPILAGACSLIFLIWTLPVYGVQAAAWCNVLRMCIQTLLLMPGMGKPVFPNLKSTTINNAWSRIKPMLLGTTYYKSDPLIDRYMLSTSISGSLSVYYLAQQICSALNQIINKAVCAPMVPLLSAHYKEKNAIKFRSIYNRKAIELGFITFISTLFIIIYGKDILTLLIGHGELKSNNIHDLWWILVCLGGVFIGGSVGQIFSSAFYASGDTITPVKISSITFSIYIPCKVAMFYIFGIKGLAITTSIYYITDCFFLAYFLRKKSF
jgi:putative peptidoglycan lipid II flippase